MPPAPPSGHPSQYDYLEMVDLLMTLGVAYHEAAEAGK